MNEYPNPDEEYEIMHLEEMEAMVELEKEALLSRPGSKKSKGCLNFDEVQLHSTTNVQMVETLQNEFPANTGVEESKKRNMSSDSLMGMTSDLEIVEPPQKKRRFSFSFDSSDAPCDKKEFGSTSFNIPKWPFVKISTSDGEKLYIKLKNDDENNHDVTKFVKNKKRICHLLETPFQELKALVDESSREKLMSNEINVEEEPSEKADLWVEQFKPRTYFDLLSDEAVNRTLLNWLKMWDKVVFNKEPKEKPLKNQNNTFKENDFKANQVKSLDDDGRPHFKIALLCGPPGLGKTTLAHIAAVMAGYNVIEINASDDRSIEALSTKLDSATQMQHVMGKCKPSCLILDEIDGAPTQTVEFLLKYVNGKFTEKTKKGKKENSGKIVKRPIVCICNELYTPSLRSLRQQAFVIHFPNTSSNKLTYRLMEICKKQNIKTDVSALTLLCDKAQNDIRSCISTLHFFKSKNSQRLKSTDILKSSMGLKDIQKSVFNIWKEIFHNPVKKPGVFSIAVNKTIQEEVSTDVNYSKKGMDRLQNLVQACQSTGDYERLMEGVYENYLKSKFSGGIRAVAQGLEWFCWFDLLYQTTKKMQNYSLMSYLPYSFGMWQMLYSSNSFWKINYPSAGYENRLKETKCDQILRDLFHGLDPSLRVFNQKQSLLFDTVPLIDVIMKPALRPVNPTLFSEGEKKDFKHLIDVMVDFNLNYIQQRSADGSYSFHLDPCIDVLIKFNESNANTSRTYSYNLKQIISHELELEKMRRSEGGLGGTDSENSTTENEAKVSTSSQSVPYKPAVLQSKEIQIKETSHYKDFFGRVISRKETTSEKGLTDKNNPIKSPIWYCFKEGYNNAVKKDITMRDLM